MEKIPAHIAIIMDGNGRWAKAQGKDRCDGHIEGVVSVKACIKAARKRGVRYLTLYAFSTENWGRPQAEVDALMQLFCASVTKETPELVEQGVRALLVVVIASRRRCVSVCSTSRRVRQVATNSPLSWHSTTRRGMSWYEQHARWQRGLNEAS